MKSVISAAFLLTSLAEAVESNIKAVDLKDIRNPVLFPEYTTFGNCSTDVKNAPLTGKQIKVTMLLNSGARRLDVTAAYNYFNKMGATVNMIRSTTETDLLTKNNNGRVLLLDDYYPSYVAQATRMTADSLKGIDILVVPGGVASQGTLRADAATMEAVSSFTGRMIIGIGDGANTFIESNWLNHINNVKMLDSTTALRLAVNTLSTASNVTNTPAGFNSLPPFYQITTSLLNGTAVSDWVQMVDTNVAAAGCTLCTGKKVTLAYSAEPTLGPKGSAYRETLFEEAMKLLAIEGVTVPAAPGLNCSGGVTPVPADPNVFTPMNELIFNSFKAQHPNPAPTTLNAAVCTSEGGVNYCLNQRVGVIVADGSDYDQVVTVVHSFAAMKSKVLVTCPKHVYDRKIVYLIPSGPQEAVASVPQYSIACDDYYNESLLADPVTAVPSGLIATHGTIAWYPRATNFINAAGTAILYGTAGGLLSKSTVLHRVFPSDEHSKTNVDRAEQNHTTIPVTPYTFTNMRNLNATHGQYFLDVSESNTMMFVPNVKTASSVLITGFAKVSQTASLTEQAVRTSAQGMVYPDASNTASDRLAGWVYASSAFGLLLCVILNARLRTSVVPADSGAMHEMKAAQLSQQWSQQ